MIGPAHLPFLADVDSVLYVCQATPSTEDAWTEWRMHAEKIRRIRYIGRLSADAATEVSRKAATNAKGKDVKKVDDDLFGGGV